MDTLQPPCSPLEAPSKPLVIGPRAELLSFAVQAVGIFDSIDANKDGQLDPDEIAAALS